MDYKDPLVTTALPVLEEPKENTPPVTDTDEQVPAQKSLILVVDDAADNVVMLSLDLQNQGYRVVTATNGEEAVTVASYARPDLILMDISMPRLDGLGATRKIGDARSSGYSNRRGHSLRHGRFPARRLRRRCCRLSHQTHRLRSHASTDREVARARRVRRRPSQVSQICRDRPSVNVKLRPLHRGLPPHSAESLRLSVPLKNIRGLAQKN